MEPLIALRLPNSTGVFHPGQNLECEYQIDAVAPKEVQAVEVSVMWFTEGKGEEDLGVHHFERITPGDAVDGDIRQLNRLTTTLPNSPLSHDGTIVKIRWCVRVRLFWGRGKESFVDRHFQLLAPPTGNGPWNTARPSFSRSKSVVNDDAGQSDAGQSATGRDATGHEYVVQNDTE